MKFKKGHKINSGRKHTEETKKKRREVWKRAGYREHMKEVHKGQHNSPITEFKKDNNPPHKGKKLVKLQGENHWNWKGGISSFALKIRDLLEYKEWRNKVFKRDNFTCQVCGKKACYLNSHHIELFKDIVEKYKIKTVEEALRCEELWDMNNGITLCEECHKFFKFRVLWISGNSGSGKTTLGKHLQRMMKRCLLLDGDAMRASISLGAGFSKKDREEHNLRVARLAKVLSQQNFMIIVTLICPYRELRKKVKKITNCRFIYLRGGKEHKDYPYEPPKKPELIFEDWKK